MAPWKNSSLRDIGLFSLFALVVFLAKFPILDVPPYWDEMGWLDTAHWLSQVNLIRAVPGLRAPDAFWGHPPGLHLTFAALAKLFGFSITLSHLIPITFACLGTYFLYLLGRELYGARTGLLAAALLFISPIYFAQAGMFLADLPVASLGVMSIYFALRRKLAVYLLCATYMVFIKETSIAVLVALLLYLLITVRPRTKEQICQLGYYAIPLVLIAVFFSWQKIVAGKFFFIYPSGMGFQLFELNGASVFQQFLEINLWIFIHQGRWAFSALIALNLVINRDACRGPELLLFLLICVFSGYSFSVLYFLPRYLLPVLSFFYLLAAGSLLSLFRGLAGKVAAAVAVLGMLVSLFTQPFIGNAEFDLGYLDVVRTHKEIAAVVEREFPQARILTFWPLSMALGLPHLGYVKKALNVSSVGFPDDNAESDDPLPLDPRADLILVMTAPKTLLMYRLKRYANENGWRLVKRVVHSRAASELYRSPRINDHE